MNQQLCLCVGSQPHLTPGSRGTDPHPVLFFLLTAHSFLPNRLGIGPTLACGMP